MGNIREAWKVVPIGRMSARDMEFARRQGILKDPDFNKSGDSNTLKDQTNGNCGWLDLGSADVLPAADIKSSWRSTVETRTGKLRDLSQA